MNYIKHLNVMLETFSLDTRLNPKHVSLYMALFRCWNSERFPTWFFISRKVLMNSSRIGSKSSYHRCLKNLHDWGYLIYKPSHRISGSRVKIIQTQNVTVPLEGQSKMNGRPVLGHGCPSTGPLSLYNKYINYKKAFEEKKEALKIVFEKEKMGSNSCYKFLQWLEEVYSKNELLKINWEYLIPVWKKELLTNSVLKDKVKCANKDNLKINKVKRYDQPL